MNIHTNLVKNKRFTSSIEPSILKHSQEYRVLATLRYVYPEKFDAMITGETPDLQDSTNSTGIEVTVAVKEDDMKVSRTFSEMNQGKDKDIEKHENIIESSGYSFIYLKGEKIAISTFGTAIGEKYSFQHSVLRKTKKLHQYRTNFKRIGLAILLPEIPTTYAEDHFSKWVFELLRDTENQFDFCYVISHRFCVYCDVQTGIFEKKELAQEESRLLSTIGRMTAEGELTMKSEEWL